MKKASPSGPPRGRGGLRPQAAATSSSEICPAGQPVLPVMFSRTKRWVVVPKAAAAVFDEDGSNVQPREGTRVVHELPSGLPWTVSVSVRVAQSADGGSFSVTLLM